jgi:carbonic anhydrase
VTQSHQEEWERLLEGVRRFRKDVFPDQQALYESLAAEGQRPHTLLIACADSRIDPERLTQSGPGQVFVARNIGNIVPPYGEMVGGVSAVVEYAVAALGVSHIVVCGHADCGAMKGLLNPDQVAAMPTVRRWLRNAEAALAVTRAIHGEADPACFMERLSEANVLLQLDHLRNHPAVAAALARGALSIHGWVYDIASGSIRMHSRDTNTFETIGA